MFLIFFKLVLGNPNFSIKGKEKECCKLHPLTSPVTLYLKQILTYSPLTPHIIRLYLLDMSLSFMPVTGFRYRPFLSIRNAFLFASIPSPTLEKLTPHYH